MPVQTYTLDPDNPKRLQISNNTFWRGATVYLDGQEIGTAASKQELLKGAEFKLPDGSILKVRLTQSLLGSELHIFRNGQPIPGSASHPETTVRTAYWALYLIGALDIVFGVIARVLHVNMLGSMGIADHSIGLGLLFILLGFLVRRHSLLALYAGIALFAADTVLGLVLTARTGGTPDMFNIIFRGLLFIPLVQGVGALRTLQAQRTPGQSLE
jgi:hypothetical protein